jgi:hypothetical protein
MSRINRPSGGLRQRLSQSSLTWPHNATEAQPSAPLSIPQIATRSISSKRCGDSRIGGSSTSAKCSKSAFFSTDSMDINGLLKKRHVKSPQAACCHREIWHLLHAIALLPGEYRAADVVILGAGLAALAFLDPTERNGRFLP